MLARPEATENETRRRAYQNVDGIVGLGHSSLHILFIDLNALSAVVLFAHDGSPTLQQPGMLLQAYVCSMCARVRMYICACPYVFACIECKKEIIGKATNIRMYCR